MVEVTSIEPSQRQKATSTGDQRHAPKCRIRLVVLVVLAAADALGPPSTQCTVASIVYPRQADVMPVGTHTSHSLLLVSQPAAGEQQSRAHRPCQAMRGRNRRTEKVVTEAGNVSEMGNQRPRKHKARALQQLQCK